MYKLGASHIIECTDCLQNV